MAENVTIKLEKDWTYRTVEKTVDYPAGEHSVAPEIAEAAEAAGVLAKPEPPKQEEKPSGDRAPTPRPTRAADAPEGE